MRKPTAHSWGSLKEVCGIHIPVLAACDPSGKAVSKDSFEKKLQKAVREDLRTYADLVGAFNLLVTHGVIHVNDKQSTVALSTHGIKLLKTIKDSVADYAMLLGILK